MKHFLGEWARKQKAGEIEKSEPKVYHHGQVYGTEDLKGDKALVRKYKTKGGEMKHPPKGKDEKREMASDLIREHMHHLGRHSGGPKQAIAIALHQAGLAKKSIQFSLSNKIAKALLKGKKIDKDFLEDLSDEERKLFHAIRHEELAKWRARRQEAGAASPKGEDKPTEAPKPAEPLFPKEAPKEGRREPVPKRVTPHDPTQFQSRAVEPHKETSAPSPKRERRGDWAIPSWKPESQPSAPIIPKRPPAQEGTFGHKLWSTLKEAQEKKSLPESKPVAVPVTPSYKPSTQAHPDVQVAHQHVQDAMGKLQALHEHLSGMAEKWKAEDVETGQKRAGLLRRSLDALVEKGHRGFYHHGGKDDPKERGGADTPKDVQAVEGGKGHSGFYRKKAPKGGRAMMGKGLDVLAEEGRAVARAARKALPVVAAVAGKVLSGAASAVGNTASGLAGAGSQSPSTSDQSTQKSVETCKGCGKAMDACKCMGKSAIVKIKIIKPQIDDDSQTSKTKKAIDILKGRMKLETDASGKMTPVATEHAPTMSLEKIESGPSAGQHKMIGPSHFEGGGSSRDKTGPDVIASTPRMHTPGLGQPGKPRVSVEAQPVPAGKIQVTKEGGSGPFGTGGYRPEGASKPKITGASVIASGNYPKPESPGERAVKELKAEKALKSLLEKSPTHMSSNPMHGEPALNPRSEKPEMHHALGAAFHERRRDSSPVGSSEWERHDMLAGGHAKKLAGVVGSPKAARVAIKQAHGTLTSQGASAIKDRHVSPGGGGTQSLPESLLHEREPAWAQPKQSASSVRGKLMASVSGQMDKALEVLLSKGGTSCPDCGKALSKPGLKRCPHCDTELPQKVSDKLNPRWGFRAAGVEKSVATAHGFKEARAMGHSLGEWSDYGRGRAIAHCKNCGEEVHAINNPNSEDGFSLHGGAVSRQCRAGTERTKMKIDDVQERTVTKAAVDPSNPSAPRPETSTPLRVGKPVGMGSYKYSKMDPFGIRGNKPQAQKQEPEKVEKAMSARSVPRMPRAMAMQMDAWRNATNVMTRTNSRFSDGINTAVLLPDPTETVPQALVDSNPVVCKGCGRSYMHKSFPAGCPTCMSRKEVPGAWDFVSKSK